MITDVHGHGAEHRHRRRASSTGSARCRSGGRRRWSARCSAMPSATSLASAVVIVLGLVLASGPRAAPSAWCWRSLLLLVFAFSLSWVVDDARPDRCARRTSVMQVSMMILFPLTFASNIFVDPATMPGWLQAFVESTRSPTWRPWSRPDARLGARRGNRLGARLVRTSRRGLRSHHHGPLPQQEIDAATASTWSTSTPTTRPTRPTPSPVPGPDTTRRDA